MSADNKSLTIAEGPGVRIILDASSIRELIKNNPNSCIELASRAAEKVGRELLDGAVNSSLKNRVLAYVDQEISAEGLFGGTRRELNAKFKAQVQTAVREASLAFSRDLMDGELAKRVRQLVAEALAAEQVYYLRAIDDKLTEKIDKLLRQRFAAMFNLPNAEQS